MRNVWAGPVNTDARGVAAAGLTIASFTGAVSLFPDLVLAPNFFSRGRQLRIHAKGMWAATGTPTYTFSVSFGGVVVVQSAAITVSALTNQAVELDVDIRVDTEGLTGTLLGQGHVDLGGVTGTQYLPATGTAPAPSASIALTAQQTLAVQVACSASSASNTLKGWLCRYEAWDFA
jgi:hypothetical protein